MSKENEDTKEIMTAKELSDYLSFSKIYIYRKAEEGVIPGARIGVNWRFKKSVIDEWLENKIGVE